MNALLHVEKEKGVEVTFDPSLDYCFPNKNNVTTLELKLIPVIISSYSKEENILNGSISRMKMKISSVPKGFRQYLYDRKKAGVISYCNSTLYVLPPKNREDDHLFCITATPPPFALNNADSVAQAETHFEIASTSSSSVTKSSSVASAPACEKQTSGAKKSDDFLSSLLSKMQGTSKLRTAVSVAAPTTVLARVEIVDRYEALASRIRGQLEAFKLDPTYMELRLEPMDKDGMYVVHDVVDDYPDLASTAIGDLEERHVVVYRTGHHPEGVDVHQQGTMVKNFTRKKKDSNYNKAVTTNALLLESISVAKVNPDGDTRDRRTIEEIQQELKKRKLGSI